MSETNKNYFIELNKIEWEVSKKQNLSYISWANAWDMVKREYPEANYKKIRNSLDNSYLFKSGTWWMCEVEVTVNWITHSADLPVLDFRNSPVAYEKIDSFQINKTLQRAFTKALAMHGIWLYVYRWEDLPDEETDKPRIVESKPEFTEIVFNTFKESENYKDHFEAYKVIEKKYDLWLKMRKLIKEYYDSKIVTNTKSTIDDLGSDKPPF